MNIIYHVKNYMNLKVGISPLYFSVLYIIITVISTPVVMSSVDRSVIEGIMSGDILRLDILPRLLMFFYEICLVPLYIKRMVSMRWSDKQREFGLIVLLLPVFLATFTSNGGYLYLSNFIGVLRLFALLFTFVLFVYPSKK